MKDYDEIPQHRKKSQTASKSDSGKRADHKHEYIPAIFISLWNEWGGVCKVCGRLNYGYRRFSTSRHEGLLRPNVKGVRASDYLTVAELKTKFPGVPIYKLDTEFKEYRLVGE